MLKSTPAQTFGIALVCLPAVAFFLHLTPSPLYSHPSFSPVISCGLAVMLQTQNCPSGGSYTGSQGHSNEKGHASATQVGDYTLINTQGSQYAFREPRAEAANNYWCCSSRSAGLAGVIDGQAGWFLWRKKQKKRDQSQREMWHCLNIWKRGKKLNRRRNVEGKGKGAQQCLMSQGIADDKRQKCASITW